MRVRKYVNDYKQYRMGVKDNIRFQIYSGFNKYQIFLLKITLHLQCCLIPKSLLMEGTYSTLARSYAAIQLPVGQQVTSMSSTHLNTDSQGNHITYNWPQQQTHSCIQGCSFPSSMLQDLCTSLSYMIEAKKSQQLQYIGLIRRCKTWLQTYLAS